MSQTPKPRTLKIFGREIRIPASRVGRIILGVLFLIFGLLGFLPVVGFWMVPVGLLILSQDFATVRRWRRRLSVWYAKRNAQKSDR